MKGTVMSQEIPSEITQEKRKMKRKADVFYLIEMLSLVHRW
jgi:hypothetical protein